MSIFLIKTLQFIVSLSIIVVIHELGHFLGAKLCKARVDKFYLFFNPWFSLFKKTYKGTEYGIGWVPLGGFVKIAGMVDESMDKEQMKKTPDPWEYRSKKPWQKLIMITGGVIFNFILAYVIYVSIFAFYGEEYVDAKNIPYGIATDSLAQSIGLQEGDVILALDGKEVDDFNKITSKIILEDARQISVMRNGENFNLSIPEDFGIKAITEKNMNFISLRFLMQPLDSVIPGSIAMKLGLAKGDQIISINEEKIVYYHDIKKILSRNSGKGIKIRYQREGVEKETESITLGDDKRLGILTSQSEKDLQTLIKRKSYSFLESLGKGFTKNIDVLVHYWTQLKIMFSGEVNLNENLGGMISIGKLFPSEWSWFALFTLTAFLSLIIGLINILPIPALDGGHMLIILIEWITGKTIPLKVLEIIQTIGIILLISLMVYAQGLDILRLFQ